VRREKLGYIENWHKFSSFSGSFISHKDLNEIFVTHWTVLLSKMRLKCGNWIVLRATAWENGHILGKSNSHYFYWAETPTKFSLVYIRNTNQIFLAYKMRSFFIAEFKIGGFAIFLKTHFFLLFYLKIFKIT
jgi:hypothetical protein